MTPQGLFDKLHAVELHDFGMGFEPPIERHADLPRYENVLGSSIVASYLRASRVMGVMRSTTLSSSLW